MCHIMKKNGSKNRPPATAEDRRKYEDAWTDMMITIWRERIERLRVHDTYALHQQIEGDVVRPTDDMTTITHKFLMYGIYQDVGVGRGFTPGNDGKLQLLDPEYQAAKGLGEPRKPRPWFSRAYFVSKKVLAEQEAFMYGEEFAGLLVSAISTAEAKGGRTLRDIMWR